MIAAVVPRIAENAYLERVQRVLRLCTCDWTSGSYGCSICARRAGAMDVEAVSAGYRLRHELVMEFAWAIPCSAALQAIAARGPVVEIGAGTGYWASLLARTPEAVATALGGPGRGLVLADDVPATGCDVVAYDLAPGFNGWCGHEPYFPVRIGGPEMVQAHQDRTLFLCWPPMADMAAQALALYTGSTVAYIGEPDGGCTADEMFHKALQTHWREAEHVAIPHWWGLHDALTIYTRKVSRRRRRS